MKIYLDYRELLNTSLFDSRGMTQSDEYKWLDFLKRKLQKREIFRTFLNSFSLSQALQLCLMKKVDALFIGENSDLKRSYESSILRNFESTSTCMKHEWSLHKVNFIFLVFFLSFSITFLLSHGERQKKTLFIIFLNMALIPFARMTYHSSCT